MKNLGNHLVKSFILCISVSMALATLAQDQTPSESSVLEPDLSKELIELGELDQKLRTTLQEKMLAASKNQKQEGTSEESSEGSEPQESIEQLWKQQTEIDQKNMKRLHEIVAKHGWPGKKLVGEKAADAAFLIVQHAELPDQEKYLPILQKAAEKNDVKQSNVAMLQDRVLMRQGKNQIYGSQLRSDPKTGKIELYPIDDPEHVDERRAKVGLPPLKDYLKLFGL